MCDRVALRLKFPFVRDIIQERSISIHHVPTEFNVADIGTRFLSEHRHRYLIRLIINCKLWKQHGDASAATKAVYTI